jgi:hypothetical protein
VFDLKRLRPNEGRLFVIVSIVIGVLAGIAVIGYHFFIAAIFDAKRSPSIRKSEKPAWKEIRFIADRSVGRHSR